MSAKFSPSRLAAALALLLLGVALPAASAQQAGRIGYVYPAGGRQGATVRVKIGGQFLDGVRAAVVSGTGVRATVVEYEKPLTNQQAMLLRDELKELQDRKWGPATRPSTRPATQPWTADDERRLMEIRTKLAGYTPRPPSPALVEIVTLDVAVAADAELGQRDLRLLTPAGLSNPLVFCVGQFPEVARPHQKFAAEPRGSEPFRPATMPGPEDSALPITLPATVNGQVGPGGADRFRFQARKGQHLIFQVRARALIPYLADAVPGWFQATLAVYDSRGREVAYVDDYRFDPDPVLHFQVPADGQYTCEIHDAIYRGRDDFVYRITIGEIPFITSVFPLGGRAGEQARVTLALTGWNLAATTVVTDLRDASPGVRSISIGGAVNTVPFVIDTLPECLEREAGHAAAQPTTLPVIINGRIDRLGDEDVYSFEGRAGQTLVAEVRARRLGSPLDSQLALLDPSGKRLAFNDDCDDKAAGLETHHADSYLLLKLPSSGTYRIILRDTQNKGGPEYAYRLRLSEPIADFALRLVPSSLNIRGGASAAATVYAIRRDGFADAIALSMKDSPAGFKLSGATIPAGQDSVRITITAPPSVSAEPVSIHLEARATVGGRSIARDVVPAEDMMQAFAYRHLVPVNDLLVTTTRIGARNPFRVVSGAPLKITPGGIAHLRIATPPAIAQGRLHLELTDAPPGISIREVAALGDGADVVIAADANAAKVGTRGNLIVSVSVDRPATQPGAATRPADAARRRTVLGAVPAVPFEVVGR